MRKDAAKESEDINNIVLGAIVGGILGGIGLYLLKTKPASPVCRVGKKITELGEIIEESMMDTRKEALEEIEKTIPKNANIINSTLKWIASGIHLWKKIVQGD